MARSRCQPSKNAMRLGDSPRERRSSPRAPSACGCLALVLQRVRRQLATVKPNGCRAGLASCWPPPALFPFLSSGRTPGWPARFRRSKRLPCSLPSSLSRACRMAAGKKATASVDRSPQGLFVKVRALRLVGSRLRAGKPRGSARASCLRRSTCTACTSCASGPRSSRTSWAPDRSRRCESLACPFGLELAPGRLFRARVTPRASSYWRICALCLCVGPAQLHRPRPGAGQPRGMERN